MILSFSAVRGAAVGNVHYHPHVQNHSDLFILCLFFSFCLPLYLFFFFFNDPAPPGIYPLPLHDALPISDFLQVIETLETQEGYRERGTHLVELGRSEDGRRPLL